MWHTITSWFTKTKQQLLPKALSLHCSHISSSYATLRDGQRLCVRCYHEQLHRKRANIIKP
jgi:cold shock CspA family protein